MAPGGEKGSFGHLLYGRGSPIGTRQGGRQNLGQRYIDFSELLPDNMELMRRDGERDIAAGTALASGRRVGGSLLGNTPSTGLSSAWNKTAPGRPSTRPRSPNHAGDTAPTAGGVGESRRRRMGHPNVVGGELQWLLWLHEVGRVYGRRRI